MKLYYSLILILLFSVFNQHLLADDFLRARKAMLENIESDVRLTSSATGIAQLDSTVRKAMLSVPRHLYVRPGDEQYAYDNRPLPIGYGQTISQPYIVAIMTDLLNLNANDKVLEIGTGSGYQAAILAAIVKTVYTIEIIEPLAKQARERFAKYGLDNIQSRVGDGYFGWQQAAPFDAIIVTAAASHVPPPLLEQLKPGGKMVIPVGSHFFTQQLMLLKKTQDGKIRSRQILPVSFVPLTGTH